MTYQQRPMSLILIYEHGSIGVNINCRGTHEGAVLWATNGTK